MKAKHIIATAGAAVIAGSIFYYLKRRAAASITTEERVHSRASAEERIRRAMHHAKISATHL